ncbi:MAG: hypothetical protein QMD06_02350, partial [Candidatus Altarchaeum sp.]|nr:hypothetical protein [Candidatus Altarchaeum sp.]
IQRKFKKIKIIVKDNVVKDDVVKYNVVKDDDNYITDIDENNNQIPIVMKIFTNYGCSICKHVDEGIKKLLDEYNKRTKQHNTFKILFTEYTGNSSRY